MCLTGKYSLNFQRTISKSIVLEAWKWSYMATGVKVHTSWWFRWKWSATRESSILLWEGHTESFLLERQIKGSHVQFATSTCQTNLSPFFLCQPHSFLQGRHKVSNVTGNLQTWTWTPGCAVCDQGEIVELTTFFACRLWSRNPRSQTKLLPRVLQHPNRQKLCRCHQRCPRVSVVRH